MNSQIGNKLKELRKQKGYTQEYIAELLCISQSAYARIENGETSSWVGHIINICNIFKILPEDLFNNEHIEQPKNLEENNSIQILNQLIIKLIEQYEHRLQEKEELIKTLLEKLP